MKPSCDGENGMNEYSQRDVPVPALLLVLLWWVLPAQQMASTARLLCQWKITEFCWSCACMWMCEGGSGANFHLLNYFQERMGNKWLPKDYKNYWHIKNQSLVLEE